MPERLDAAARAEGARAPARRAVRLLRLLIGLALLAIAIALVRPERVREAARPVGIGALAGAAGLYLAGQLFSAWKWQRIARRLGVSQPFWKYPVLYLSGMFLNLLLPTSVGGDLGRGYLIAPGEPARGIASVLLERAIGLAVLFAILAAAAAGAGGPQALGVGGAALAALVLMVSLAAAFSPKARARPARWPWLAALRESFAALRDPRLLAAALLLSAAFYACYVGLHVLLARRLGIAVPVAVLAEVVTLGSLAAMLPISLGGIGLREAAYVGLLSFWGVDQPKALALGLCVLGAQLAVAMAGGVGLLLLRRRSREVS